MFFAQSTMECERLFLFCATSPACKISTIRGTFSQNTIRAHIYNGTIQNLYCSRANTLPWVIYWKNIFYYQYKKMFYIIYTLTNVKRTRFMWNVKTLFLQNVIMCHAEMTMTIEYRNKMTQEDDRGGVGWIYLVGDVG